MHNLNFYEVLEMLLVTKAPLRARRKDWKDKYIFCNNKYETCILTLQTSIMRLEKWTPKHSELIADDWIIE